MALVLVTGAATGLGLATAQALAADGHDVVAHARNPSRLAGAGLLDQVRGAIYGNLAEHQEVVALAGQADEYGRFDAVIHNAGVLTGPDVLAVNTLAPYILTARLRTPHRLVYLSSSMRRSGSANLQGLTTGRVSYEDSKLYVTALAAAIASRCPETASHAVDPGWVPTRMGGPGATDDLRAGHETQVWLATGQDIEPRTGGYWYHRHTQRPHPAAQDATFQAELIAGLEARTGISLG
ncbi:SDR family NAD(P)-dependent oxidoreductase [Amycolatopsis sp. MtRt-6]|uniref:SDR family NAD(P)-dependent oxidoreductase n=1 Tax=Amycolatopsis sp. MtRt-6 TaxID=2792782 RepID=UPI001A8C79C3|nr:SDR family NAD(P)-dependent oxidoreductase [Amycolatopsis sp. MtRt-6]